MNSIRHTAAALASTLIILAFALGSFAAIHAFLQHAFPEGREWLHRTLPAIAAALQCAAVTWAAMRPEIWLDSPARSIDVALPLSYLGAAATILIFSGLGGMAFMAQEIARKTGMENPEGLVVLLAIAGTGVFCALCRKTKKEASQ